MLLASSLLNVNTTVILRCAAWAMQKLRHLYIKVLYTDWAWEKIERRTDFMSTMAGRKSI